MQTAGGRAIAAFSVAGEMFKMQDDPARVVRITGEKVQGFRRAAPAIDRVANLGRKAVNVLGIVAILRAIRAAFC